MRDDSRALGAALAIETWVAVQFFEITLVQVGGFPVSIQKLVSILVFPFALVLLRRWVIPRVLVVLLLVMVAANSLWYWWHGMMFDSRMLSANITTVSTVFGATVLYTALISSPEGFVRLGRAWVRWSLVTAPICVLQAVHVLPLFNVPAEMLLNRATGIGFDRAVGFKADPNFQALMLVIGALFVLTYHRNRLNRAAQLTVIGVGVLATFSRMGILLFALGFLVGPLAVVTTKGYRRVARALFAAAGVLCFGVITFMGGMLPRGIEHYIADRFVDAWQVFGALLSGQTPVTASGAAVSSAMARLLLAAGALHSFLANPWIGIGAGRSKELLVATTGQLNVAHNTYLEMAMMGGVVGILFLVIYFTPLFRLLRHPVEGLNQSQLGRVRGCGIGLYVVFALVFLLLSLNANSILYVPVALALALLRMSSDARAVASS